MRMNGSQVLTATEVIGIGDCVVQEIIQDLDMELPCIITLWHDNTQVYDPEIEDKPYILTMRSQGGISDDLDEIHEEELLELKAIVAKLRKFYHRLY